MLGNILLALWTAACIAGGVLLGGRSAGRRELRREKRGTETETDAEAYERIRAELAAEIPEGLRTQWDNMMRYDGSGRGQNELDR